MSVIKGTCMERLPGDVPGTRSGDRIFDGWYTADGAYFDGTTPVVEDIVVYERSHEVSGTDGN